MKPTVALVLGSGGARGHAHIGVIEELEARGYDIQCVAGCSIGAIVGGVYAAGKLAEYKAWINTLDTFQVLRLMDVNLGLGAMQGRKVFGLIQQMLGEINIEDLPIPFTAVATDLTAQQEVWFQEGCLHKAMRASAAIPSLLTPVLQGNRLLVDGGLLNPLPIVPVVSSHCDVVIAVNLAGNNHQRYPLPHIERPAPLKHKMNKLLGRLGDLGQRWAERNGHSDMESLIADLRAELPFNEAVSSEHAASSGKAVSANTAAETRQVAPGNLLEVVNHCFETMQGALTQYKIAGYPPDLLINIPKRVCRFYDFDKGPELIALGRQIARDRLDDFEKQHG
ncbi:patatin-like phospholipase family protein [Atopomonas sediminilitoris]|uniref:patatin-like phospholipase family protein n=1 Tax=Atopomonas sediminilitoris TaxID=2919919 RepID=UPI001F4D49DA|nr:patatin-like phospholipase family protein [Atopomonas sediminilitoris]MCJ8168899.1 patatin-like phospholipase family protein [Atopomonas sediminilitoris]